MEVDYTAMPTKFCYRGRGGGGGGGGGGKAPSPITNYISIPLELMLQVICPTVHLKEKVKVWNK